MRRELFRTFITHKPAFRIFGERLWLIFVARCLISSRLGFPFFITYLKNRDKICNFSSLYSHLSASAYVSMWNGRQNSVRKRDQSGSHLSKWPSDLKSNGTQENITFSGPVFHGLSCGVFLFVASVSFKNHLLNGLNFSTANQVLLFYGF